MLLGRTVFMFRTEDGLSRPAPAIVVAENGTDDADRPLVDVNAFYSTYNSTYPPLLAKGKVVYCETSEEIAAAFAEGCDYACFPYDPQDPVLPEPVKKAPKKVAAKAKA